MNIYLFIQKSFLLFLLFFINFSELLEKCEKCQINCKLFNNKIFFISSNNLSSDNLKNMNRNNRNHFKNKKYTMMKDFDILAMPTESQKQLYEQANFQKGIQMMTPTYVRDEDGDKFSLWIPIQQFMQFGPGIYLLFLFLKYATILFLLISVLSFINIGVLLGGGQLNLKYSNFQIDMAKSTLGNASHNSLVVIVIFDYIITVIILVSIIYWKQKQATFVVECCKNIMLRSYRTVILKQIPELYTQSDIKLFLQERFGQVQDIYTVRNFSNDLYHYKQITQIANQYKQQRVLVKLKPQRGSIKLAKLFFDYRNYYFKMQNQHKLSKYPTQFVYITFKSVKSRQQMLKFYTRTFPQLLQDKKDYYLYKGQELKIKACMMEPNGIKWQNLNLPRKDKFKWILIQISLLVLVLILSIIVIFILYVSQSSLSHTEYYGKNKDQILALNSKQALQSYCLGLSISNFNSDDSCSQFSGQYLKYTILFVTLPLVLALFKFVLTQLMKALVSIRRHPYQIQKIQSQIIIMFVFYFFASGILQYIVFLEIKFSNNSSFSFVNIMNPIQKTFVGFLNLDTQNIRMATDYNRTWYTIASYKIILIAIVSFNASSFGKIIYSFLRKLACDIYARKQVLQKKMNYWLEGQQMQIQFVYAVAATVICYLLLFGASLPLLYPFTCISLFFLFWTSKFIFINYCAKPLLYSHSMNSIVVKILLVGVVIHCFVAPLYFGAQSIHSEKGISNFLRIPYFGYYILLMVIAIIYMAYRQKIANLFEKVKNYYTYQDEKQDNFASKRSKKMSLPSKLCLIQEHKDRQSKSMSYSMHQNPQYQSILKTLYTINKQQRIRATCVLNKQLYNLLQKDQNFAEAQQNITGPKLFYELLRIIESDFSKFEKRVGKEYSKSNNPYKFYLKELKQIQRESKISENDPDIFAQLQAQGFMSGSLKNIDVTNLKQNLQSNKQLHLSYLKKLESLRKRFKPKQNLRQIVERSDEQSISKNIPNNSNDQDQAPSSDVRLRSTMNIGLVSNLGMVSNIGFKGIGGVSNLGTMSRINRRNSLNTNNDQKMNEMYLIEDKFDCIKQTQSIIDSKVYSKKYNNQPPEKDIPSNYQIRVTTPNLTRNVEQELKKFNQLRKKEENRKSFPKDDNSQRQSSKTKEQQSKQKESNSGEKNKKKRNENLKKVYKRRKQVHKHFQNDFSSAVESDYDQSNCS